MQITLITPTGDRPEAFTLCERYMAGQSRRWDQWIVVDDGEPETTTTMGQSVIRPEPRHTGKGSTQWRNLMVALPQVTGDAVLIVEDDDWYGPDYIRNAVEQLEKHELVGEVPARYYNVRFRTYREFGIGHHASLCQTAFRRTMLMDLAEVCKTNLWIDTTLWQRNLRRGYLYRGEQVIGIKGMPGRKGISTAHTEVSTQWGPDPDCSRLRQWVGKDAAKGYEPYFVSSNWWTAQRPVNEEVPTRTKLETFFWKHQIRYRCPECSFDGPSELAVLTHWKHSHVAQDQPGGGPTLFDAEDRPIGKIENVPESLKPFL